MKKILFPLLVIMALAATAFGQVQFPVPDRYVGEGPTFAIVDADTIWFTQYQNLITDANEATLSFDGEAAFPGPHMYPLYLNYPYGETGTVKKIQVRPTAVLAWADKPFRWQGFIGGDSLTINTIFTHVDTVFASSGQQFDGLATVSDVKYPCWTLIKGAVDTLRFDSVQNDTLYVKALLEYPPNVN